MKNEDLDGLFADLRTAPLAPTSDFMARVMADALAEQPQPALSPRAAIATTKQGLWPQILGALGGGVGMAGLGTAMLAGLWVGFAAPAPLAGLSSALGQDMVNTPVEQVDLLASYDSLLIGG